MKKRKMKSEYGMSYTGRGRKYKVVLNGINHSRLWLRKEGSSQVAVGRINYLLLMINV